MATILIEPIQTQTRNGSPVEIRGIDINDEDKIHGSINGNNHKWNKSGICRGASDEFNIDPREDNIRELIETIEKLGG